MEKQDMQLIIEILAKAEANRKTDKEERKKEKEERKKEMEAKKKTDKEDFLAKMEANKEDLMAKLDAYQAKTDAVLLAMQVMETSHKEIVPECKPETETKTMACQGNGGTSREADLTGHET
jgi:hypothetical protein